MVNTVCESHSARTATTSRKPDVCRSHAAKTMSGSMAVTVSRSHKTVVQANIGTSKPTNVYQTPPVTLTATGLALGVQKDPGVAILTTFSTALTACLAQILTSIGMAMPLCGRKCSSVCQTVRVSPLHHGCL